MFTKMKNWWNELDCKIEINKRELVLGAAVCALWGLATGMLLSPKKNVHIGSNNGSNNTGNSATATAPALEAESDTSEEEEA